MILDYCCSGHGGADPAGGPGPVSAADADVLPALSVVPAIRVGPLLPLCASRLCWGRVLALCVPRHVFLAVHLLSRPLVRGKEGLLLGCHSKPFAASAALCFLSSFGNISGVVVFLEIVVLLEAELEWRRQRTLTF